MGKNLIFNMGYDTSHITSVIAKEGLEDGSTIILIAPERSNERQKNALDDVRNHLESLSIDIEMQVPRATKNIYENLKSIGTLLDERSNIVLSLSGGPRDTLIPLTLAATFKPQNIQTTYFRSDIDSELKKIEIPTSKTDLSEANKKILDKCSKQPNNVQELVRNTEFSESTVYRNKNELIERGLLETQNESKKLITTTLGEFYLS